ncbi:MAG: hypothetical protein JRJ65_13275 [Deltaproteobacteria bacterium]|nr:hypothetical protein [Deltaproteobacteria bacterium]
MSYIMENLGAVLNNEDYIDSTIRKSRLSQHKQNRLIEHFAAGTTAHTASVLLGVNKSTASYYFYRLREPIYQEIEDTTPLSGEIEIDESCFGGRPKGKRGRGAAGKAPALMQRAIAHLLEESIDISFYQKNRDMLFDGLSSCGFDVFKSGTH